jgi:shikimate O-hydroxycinnamoyltransferase
MFLWSSSISMNQSISHAVADIVSQISHSLKQSLSETLTRFYPFAGKIKDRLSIDCNDEGVFYLEACVNCHLVECLSQPNIPSLQKFLPRESWKDPTEGDHVTMIQVTRFACGGIAIGVLVSHMIADGISLSIFLKGRAATARKACEVVCPNFDSPSIFIQNDAYSREAVVTAFSKPFKLGRCIVRRIVFDASAIASLKAKASSSSVRNPTRVEAVSALLWKCIMTAFKATSGIQRPTFITHAVNLRPRADPQFTESSMGNILWSTCALCTAEEIDLASMVSKLREARMKINIADFVKNIQGDGGFSKLWELVKARTGAVSSMAFSCGVDYIGFTSWCNIGVYDIDFGWGKPMWVSQVGTIEDSETMFRNRIYLMDTRSSDGIEAWVLLDAKDMIMLAQDNELLAFASLDRSPIE